VLSIDTDIVPIGMPITGISPWFGGKRTLAPTIVAQLGPHRAYWEPFCGSMAVLMGKPPCRMETVNDLHGDLVNLARVVQHPTEGPRLYRRCRRVWLAEALFKESSDVIRGGLPSGDLDPERAFHYFVVSWFGMNGVAGTLKYNANFLRRFTNNGGHTATRWGSAVQSIPAWRRRLSAATILSADGIALCERIEDVEGCVIYADPPYLVKGAKYLHDFDWLAHRRLAKALARFRHTRVVVSYYEHPDLAAMYAGWTKVEVHTTKALVSSGRAGGTNDTRAPEVLLINGPSLAKGEA
jgi:DNA adenine methylase